MNAGTLRWIGAAGIVAIAVMRCCIAFAGQIVFDADPVFDSAAPSALGPAGSLVLDVALIACCLIALLGEWRGGRGLDPLLLTLALLPLPVIIWHASGHAAGMWRGGTWFAAAVACATIAHLARDRTMRIAMTSSLIAVIVPLLARGATQMTWEHDATVAAYQETKADFLAARGWEADSPATRIYERRLMHREPTGWFPSTNIYGSVMGAATIMLAGLAVIAFAACRRGTMQSGGWFLMAMLMTLCAIALRLTTSTGALLASIAGAIALIAAMLLASTQRRGLIGLLSMLLVAMILGATAGVIVRGTILPEGFAHERSLLFRWHYLQSAASMFMDDPIRGVGPSGFQMAYMAHRVPRNPEEVQSAHAMFTDWLASLGVLGGAWIAMIVVMAVRSGRSTEEEAPSPAPHAAQAPASPAAPATPDVARITMRFAAAVALLALGPAAAIEFASLSHADLLIRALCIAGVIAIAAIIASILSQADDWMLRSVAFAGAAVLLVHGQIEMSFHHGGSVVWLMAVTGLLASAQPARSMLLTHAAGTIACSVLALTAGWLAISGALPALAQQRSMMQAAAMLAPIRQNPDDLAVALQQRRAAAEKLVESYALWPTNNQPLNAAIDQLLIAAERPQREADSAHTGVPIGLLMRAEEIAEYALARHVSASSTVLAINVHAGLASLTGDNAHWTRAIELATWMASTVDPQGVSPWQRLGDVLWAAGRKHEAADAYRRALDHNDNFELDPLKQLSDAYKTSLQRRIDEAARTSGGDE